MYTIQHSSGSEIKKVLPYISLVVAVDEKWGIGNNGRLLAHVSDDMKRFRSLTVGKTVILGSKTLATFPGGKPLKNRRNIILSHRKDFTVEGGEIAHSTDELFSLLSPDEENIVIGGSSVYAQLLPYCNTAYVTRFEACFEADAFFPDLDEDANWSMTEQSELLHASESDDPSDITYRFCTYKRRKPYTQGFVDLSPYAAHTTVSDDLYDSKK